MKVFSAKQIREIDRATIENEPIDSIDLMERAATALFYWVSNFVESNDEIVVVCGQGNNGGDGLALGRLLNKSGFNCKVYIIQECVRWSVDAKHNFDRYVSMFPDKISVISKIEDLSLFDEANIVIDAIFGSGLTREVEGLEARLIDYINSLPATVISIDIPSGLFAEDNDDNTGVIIEADYTLSFEAPFLSFFFAENNKYVGEWFILPIGLHAQSIASITTPFDFVDEHYILDLYQKREKFAHKGTFGHALLIAGSYGKTGAAVLASKACLRTGCGLLTAHTPKSSYQILQTACPETMLSIDISQYNFSNPPDCSSFSALGVGPGIGKETETVEAMRNLMLNLKIPAVFDADALNIMAENSDIYNHLPAGSILTPHPGEFHRLFGKTKGAYSNLMLQISMSVTHKLIIVKKGAYTSVTTPDGKCFFNSTGNPGMATAGSGDVLTGMILSLLSQRYIPEHASVLGVWLHGKAGDIALNNESQESLIASDIIENIGNAFKTIIN